MTDNTEQLAAGLKIIFHPDARVDGIIYQQGFEVKDTIRQLLQIIREQGEVLDVAMHNINAEYAMRQEVYKNVKQSLAKTKAIRELEV